MAGSWSIEETDIPDKQLNIGMAEWFKATVCKTVQSWVQIPFPILKNEDYDDSISYNGIRIYIPSREFISKSDSICY